uniref:(northern house mosquito) hypothetical protein n=1 Tax=Culex pipiens TaxID=7175 RepID=A0A8D8E0M1_CULPI
MWTSAVASSTPAPKHSRNEISDGKRSRLRWAQNSGKIPATKLPNPSARMANSLASFLLMLVSGSSRMLVTLANGPCCGSVRSIVRFRDRDIRDGCWTTDFLLRRAGHSQGLIICLCCFCGLVFCYVATD